MTRLGKLAAGALLMAGTAAGTTVATTTPASARVVVGIGVGVPGYWPGYYPGYYGYPCGYYYGYCGYPAYYGYGGPYVWWGGAWHWRAGFGPGFRGRFGDRDGFREGRFGDRGRVGGHAGPTTHAGGFHGR